MIVGPTSISYDEYKIDYCGNNVYFVLFLDISHSFLEKSILILPITTNEIIKYESSLCNLALNVFGQNW